MELCPSLALWFSGTGPSYPKGGPDVLEAVSRVRQGVLAVGGQIRFFLVLDALLFGGHPFSMRFLEGTEISHCPRKLRSASQMHAHAALAARM
jgi:hypothetical protein